MIKIKTLITLMFLCITIGSFAQDLSNSRPNIIIIVPDDISWGEHSYYSKEDAYGSEFKTPNIDELFDQGLRFNSFHVSPTCSPTRAAMMIGEHEFYGGITHTIFMRDILNTSLKTMPEMMKEAGYTTGMFGKWHLGDDFEARPKQRGFDEVLQHGGGGILQDYPHSADFPGNGYNDPYLLYNEELIKEKGYCTDIFFDYAINWINKVSKENKPFLAYIPTNVAHVPYIAPEDEEHIENNIWRELNKKIVSNLDDNVGKMMTFLKSSNLDDNTLVIYFTDNGSKGAKARGLLGGKGKASEGGIRVPCVFYWKGKIGNTTTEINDLVGHMDLYRTFANLAGHEEKTDSPKLWGGKDITTLLELKESTIGKRYWIGHRARWRKTASKNKYVEASIQDEEYKLYFKTETKFSLHNLTTDLGERKDIKEQHPEKVEELKKQFDLFWEDVQPHMTNENKSIPEFNKPFHEIYENTLGKEAYDEAVKKQTLFDAQKKILKKK